MGGQVGGGGVRGGHRVDVNKEFKFFLDRGGGGGGGGQGR